MGFLDKYLSKREEMLRKNIVQDVMKNIFELSPERRYILFIPQDAQAELFAQQLQETLQLSGTNLRIAIVSGDVKLLEI